MEQQTDQVLAAIEENNIENLLQLTGSNLVENKLSLQIDVKLINEMIIIYYTLNQKVKTITNKRSSKNNSQIDATNLVHGIYYLSIETIAYMKPIKLLKIC